MKKLEKDVDRHKFGSTQMLERNEQLVKEMENVRAQNLTLREQLTKMESDLNDAQVRINEFLTEYFHVNLMFDRLHTIDWTIISNEEKMT